MYGLVQKKKIIAIHDDRDVVVKYQETLKSQCTIKTQIVKLDKKVRKSVEYPELYLIRYGDSYVPSRLFATACDLEDQSSYDLKYAYDVLKRIMEYSTDKKDIKHLVKSLMIIQRELDEIGQNPIDQKTIEEVHALNESFKEKMWDD